MKPNQSIRGYVQAAGGILLLGLVLTPPLTLAQDGDTDPRLQKFREQHSFQNGVPIAPDAYDQAAEQWRLLPRTVLKPSGPKAATFSVSGVNGTVWKPLGPSPIKQSDSSANGRVSAIAVHPTNPNILYIGASGGGVWRSDDWGATWSPLFDQQPSLGIGDPSAIAIDPNNPEILYVGTSSRFVLNVTKGILKSTDSGGSWIVLGSDFPSTNSGNADNLFAGNSVNKIIVDPANSSVLYAATSIGLYRSTDAGRNWSSGINSGGDSQSLVLDTSSPVGARILYAGVNGSGVRQTTNGGANWQTILNSATPVVNAALFVTGTVGKVVVDLAPPTSPPNPNGAQVLYVTMSGGNGAPDPVGIFQSTDQGANWNQRPGVFAAGRKDTQGGYDLELNVDPASPGDGVNDILYYAAVSQFKSTDSGANFANISNGQHVDTHAGWVFVRQPSPTPSTVYTGNDGGIWRSIDGGDHWTGTGQPGAPATINAGGYQAALFYNMDVKRDSSASVTEGGLQDNGIVRTTGTLEWTDTKGGDGWDIRFDFIDTDKAYHSGGFYCCGNPCTLLFKSTDSGATWPNTARNGIPDSELGCGVVSITMDPSNAGVLYASGLSNFLYQSTDAGANYRQLGNFGGGLGDAEVARANSNNVVVASGGRVFVSVDAHAATPGFSNITRNLPGGGVSRVAFDPNDPSLIYATLASFGAFRVARTRITDTAWIDISPPVNVPVNALLLDGSTLPTTIYIGNDLGVMRSVNGGFDWTVLDDAHLPNVPVTDLAFNTQAKVLRAATFGRGAFELSAPDGPVIAVNAQDGLNFGLACVGTPQSLTLQVFNVGTSNLTIYSVYRLMGSTDFKVLPNPSTPLIISPNAEVDFMITYTPATPGAQQATIRISSSDPGVPYYDLTVSAIRTNAVIVTAIADSGNFGDVCLGAYKDLNLSINNSGPCDLLVSNITSTLAQFQTASVISYPLLVHPGDTIAVPIRFQPTSLGGKTAMISVFSNDPNVPVKLINVSGNVPPGDIRVTGSTEFGDVCAGSLAEKTISICNVGACNLTVTSIVFTAACPDFTLINNPFPAVISHDSCVELTIRFTPTSCGAKACTLQILSDDPDTPVILLTLTANTPCPEIDVSPDLGFLPEIIQRAGACNTLQPFPISNKGKCNLTVTSITITGVNAADFGLSGLPSFPIILEPGHIVGEGDLNVKFAPTEIARERSATINVTYLSDPVAGTSGTISRQLCGEGVLTGARVLVTSGGLPINFVEKIQLQRINANRNKDQLDTQDVAQNLPLVTVNSTPPCEPFQYHREYGTVSNPIQLLPGSYQVTASAIINGKRKSKSVGFNVDTCDFNPTVVVNF